MKKEGEIRGESEEILPTKENPDNSAGQASGFWDGKLDHETTKQMGHWETQRRHENEIEHLGKEELVKLREKGEQGINELTPEQTRKLIKELGDQVFHKMAMEEDRKRQQIKDREQEDANKKRKRDEWLKGIEDKKPINRIKRFFRTMFIEREE
jgi:hypothetical protein